MTSYFDRCGGAKLKKHTELRELVESEKKVMRDVRTTENDRMMARQYFQDWTQGRSDDLNAFGDILSDSFQDQRASYREYFQQSDSLVRHLERALEEEKFLDPTKKELSRREKKLKKEEKRFRKTKNNYDKSQNKPDFDLSALRYNRKIQTSEMKRDQALRMVDTAKRTYDAEERRVTDESRHDVILGYCKVMKQEYSLLRSRIQELEKVFEVVRNRFPVESQEADLPREKLTPILKLSEEKTMEDKRLQLEKETAARPKISLEQAVSAALPPGVHKSMAGIQSPMISKKPENIITTAPLPPPMPSSGQMQRATRHQMIAQERF